MAENARISDADLIRVLGDYTAKAASAHQTYWLRVAVSSISLFTVAALVGMGLALVEYELILLVSATVATLVTIVLILVLLIGAAMLVLYVSKLKTAVELATWQLRRVYELVSRREDLGVDVDSGTRLEMELRLGEAAFLLTTLERFERPEKFRQFQRMGRNSPFRENEPENSLPSPPTKAVTSAS